MYVIPVGLLWFAIYYFSFRFFIKRFKVATPGHLEDTDAVNTVAASDGAKPVTDIQTEAAKVLAALGGEQNIEDVDACITRLRVAVKDPEQVDKATLKALGATDVFEVRGGVQAVYGAKAILYKNAINESLGIDD